jgi:AcrR family transcriptional regulator
LSNREALLEGALLCLQERGYARTTARDIVAAAGTNLGAIGYHYGTTENLLNAAVIEGFERWFGELERSALAAGTGDGWERLLKITAEVPRTFERNRMLARSFIEALAQAERSQEIRAALAASYERGRANVIVLLGANPLPGTEDFAHPAASLLIAIFDGLLLQWLLDPQRTPTGEQLIALAMAWQGAGGGGA